MAVSAPPAPGPCERDLADLAPAQHDGVEAAADARERVLVRHEHGRDAGRDALVGEARVREQLDRVAELVRERHIVVVQLVDALERHVVDVQVTVERERRQDRELGGRVGAADVLGGIGLGVAELLRLGQRVGVAPAVARHRAEHEVGRAVDDPDQLVDPGRGERLLQHAHDRDRRAGRGLVAELRPAALGGLLQLGAVAREQLLVRGDDRDAALEQLAQIAERRLDAAHDLGHDLDRGIVADVLEAVGEQAGRRALALAPASRTSARTTRTGRPATRSTTSARSRSSRSTDEPTVPYPSRPMPSGSLVTGAG